MTQKVLFEDIKVLLEDTKVLFEDRRKPLKSTLQYCRRAIKVFFEDTLPLLPITTYNIYPEGYSFVFFPFLKRTIRKANFFYNRFSKGTFTIALKIRSMGPGRFQFSQKASMCPEFGPWRPAEAVPFL